MLDTERHPERTDLNKMQSSITNTSRTDINLIRQGPSGQMLDPSTEYSDLIRRGLSCQSSHNPDGDSHKRGSKRKTETTGTNQVMSQLENTGEGTTPNTCSVCDQTCLSCCFFVAIRDMKSLL